jgi:outer membrane protein assembly factor BamD (BamD/ComL family)
LIDDALASKRQGHTVAALDALEALIQRYPQSPLRETAEAERMRLLAATHSERAPEAARAYLARYPKGAAAGDAAFVLERFEASEPRERVEEP